MAICYKREYFRAADYIDMSEIFRPLRSSTSDLDISNIIRKMNIEGKEILGSAFSLRFDPDVSSKDVARRVTLTLPLGTVFGG